jgi:hypothetical protein
VADRGPPDKVLHVSFTAKVAADVVGVARGLAVDTHVHVDELYDAVPSTYANDHVLHILSCPDLVAESGFEPLTFSL